MLKQRARQWSWPPWEGCGGSTVCGPIMSASPLDGKSMTSDTSPYKSRGGPARLLNAIRYSTRGFAAAFRHEAAFRQELLLVIVLMPIAVWLGRSLTEILLLLSPLFLILVVELLNSSIEALADTITLEHHPLIGRAKDLGSAAVFLTIAFSVVIWTGVILSHAFEI